MHACVCAYIHATSHIFTHMDSYFLSLTIALFYAITSSSDLVNT